MNADRQHRILIEDQGFIPTPALDRLKRNMGRSLDHLAATEQIGEAFEVSVVFVDDAEIRDLNRQYRGQDRATDVLSFSQFEGEAIPSPDGVVPLGDLVVSVETARRQAQAIGHSEEYEWHRLLVHGLYHLIGYDHERSPDEERKMQEREDSLLELLEEQGGIE